jgi:hypothetical protein
MVLTNANTSFWLIYGVARRDPVIFAPNAMGLVLGIIMMILCLVYPRSAARNDNHSGQLLLDEGEDESTLNAENLDGVLT